MKTSKTYKAPFRRRKEQKTDYSRRLKRVKSDMPRFVVRRSNAHVQAQLIAYDPAGDRVIASAHTKEFEANGWKSNKNNSPAAYLVGKLAARRARIAHAEKAQFDIGFATAVHRGVVFAALKGAVDGGLAIPHDPAVLPSADRVNAKHLPDAAQKSASAIAAMIDGGKMDKKVN